MTFYNKRPSRKSPRLQGYDYSQSGYYFITICVENHLHLFGDIDHEGNLQLNDIGEMVSNQWKIFPKRFPTAICDQYIVMPNHFHGIIQLSPITVTTVLRFPKNVGKLFPNLHHVFV